MKAWSYYRRSWNVNFFRFKVTYWELSPIRFQTINSLIAHEPQKVRCVANDYLYFLEDV